MKVDSFKNNRKALFALLLCSGFIATHPLAVMAESENYSVQNVQQKQTVSGIVKDSSGEPIIGASVLEKGTTNVLLLIWMVNLHYRYLLMQCCRFLILAIRHWKRKLVLIWE